jgi:hypothetical protein
MNMKSIESEVDSPESRTPPKPDPEQLGSEYPWNENDSANNASIEETGENYESSSDEDADVVSETSTVRYEQEPFEEFKTKVLALCHVLWPNRSERDFDVEHMAGGSYHRIVGINIGIDCSVSEPSSKAAFTNKKYKQFFLAVKSFPARILQYLRSQKSSTSPTTVERYILRIPRFGDEEDFDFEYSSALLRFLDGLTEFAVPKTIRFDKTSDNPLGKPYVLQHRIPGKPLEDLWEELNHAQRLSVARQLAKFLLQLTKPVFSCGGKLNSKSVPEAEYGKETRSRSVEIHQFPYYLWGKSENVGQPGRNVAPAKLLQDRYLEWKVHNESDTGEEDFTPWRTLAEMVHQMDEKTTIFGPESNYYIYHGDLFPRNLMVEILDKSTVAITGILDWDHSAFGPAIVAFESPSWLWLFDKYMSNDLEFAIAQDLHQYDEMEPQDEHAREIKLAFESAVGSEFWRYAAAEEASVARWLWTWGVEGVSTSTYWKLVHEALKQFGLDPMAEFMVADKEVDGEGSDVEIEGQDDEVRDREEQDHNVGEDSNGESAA